MFTVLIFALLIFFPHFYNCISPDTFSAPSMKFRSANCDINKGNIPVELFKAIINGNLFTEQFKTILEKSTETIEDLKFPATCPHDIKALVKKADANGDGALDLAEYKQLLTNVLFANIVDQNRDGCATKKELDQYEQKCGGIAEGLGSSTTTTPEI